MRVTIPAVAFAWTLCALCAEAAVHDVRAYGAKGDGVTKDTAALQAAIDAAAKAGGGEVLVPSGRYLSGTLYLKSNVEVNLALGATIEGSNVDGFRLEGGTLKEIKLSKEEYERRCEEIETFKRMLY